MSVYALAVGWGHQVSRDYGSLLNDKGWMDRDSAISLRTDCLEQLYAEGGLGTQDCGRTTACAQGLGSIPSTTNDKSFFYFFNLDTGGEAQAGWEPSISHVDHRTAEQILTQEPRSS